MDSLKEKVITAALILNSENSVTAENSLTELAELVDTAGGTVVGELTQKRDKPCGATLLGEGKLQELKQYAETLEADCVVFDTELSPVQLRNIEKELDGVKVIDRTMIILDIFAARARSSEGKLQVELAQLKYTMPRLSGMGTVLSRQGGGIGTRGPGETRLESDRRHIQRRINSIKTKLSEIEERRTHSRKRRSKDGFTTAAIVGYTNAGKSTLLNTLTRQSGAKDADVYTENKLFATLDTTTRSIRLKNGSKILVTDTVGLIRNLPHHLVESFKSTLEEAVYADILIHVCDAGDPELAEKITVTEELLRSLGCGEIPTVRVYNKCDTVAERGLSVIAPADTTALFVSAKTGAGISDLLDLLEKTRVA